MRTSILSSCFFLIGILGIVAVPDIRAQSSQERILKEAESRLRAIYEREEFRAKTFRADWLSDSSGYTVLESVPDAKEQVPVRYDAASGERTVLDSPRKEKAGRSGNIAPDGKSVLYSEQGNLYVRDLGSDRKIPLTNSAADRSVSNSRAVWSPDGKWIAFVQSDDSEAKIIHGTGETNTHLQITEGLVDRLIELGKQFDYMAYPNRDHGLREGRGTAIHVRMLMTRYLIEHLPPGPR